MRILDTKQQQLNSTKRASQTMEQQVKQLKHEAHVLRKQLDSAQTLHRTEAELKLWQEQRVKILQESLATRRDKEKRQLEHDLHQIVTLMNRLACSHELLSRMYEVECIQLAKELAEENGIVPEHSAQMQRKKEELVAFAASALEQLQELTAAVDSSVDINMESTVLACRTKVDDLIRRIRTYSATEAQTNSWYHTYTHAAAAACIFTSSQILTHTYIHTCAYLYSYTIFWLLKVLKKHNNTYCSL